MYAKAALVRRRRHLTSYAKSGVEVKYLANVGAGYSVGREDGAGEYLPWILVRKVEL